MRRNGKKSSDIELDKLLSDLFRKDESCTLYRGQFLECLMALHPRALPELKAAIDDPEKLDKWKKDWNLADEWCVDLLLNPPAPLGKSSFDVEMIWPPGLSNAEKTARLDKFFSDRRAFLRRERSDWVYEAADPKEVSGRPPSGAESFFPITLRLEAAEYYYDPIREKLVDFRKRVFSRVNELVDELGNFCIARARDMGAKPLLRKRARKNHREQYEWLVRYQMGETAYEIAGGKETYATNHARTVQLTVNRLASQIGLTLPSRATRHKATSR